MLNVKYSSRTAIDKAITKKNINIRGKTYLCIKQSIK